MSFLDYNSMAILRATCYRGVAQLVARDIWDVDAAGSNPVTPTISSVHNGFELWTLGFFAFSVCMDFVCQNPMLATLVD